MHATLGSLAVNIAQDQEPTVAEKDFLNAIQLPVDKILNVTTAYRYGTVPLDIHHYSDLIVTALLYKYILEVKATVPFNKWIVY